MRALLGMVLVVLTACTPTTDVQLYAVEFGAVELGAQHEATLRVKNTGGQTTTLLRVEQRDGDRGFSVVPRFEPLPSGETTTWVAHFDAVTSGLARARFVAVFAHGEEEVVLTARAAAQCEVGPALDFGVGPRGERQLSYRLVNDGASPMRAFVGALTAPFSSDVAGEVVLAPRSEKTVTVRYAANDDGAAEVQWALQPRDDCARTTLTVRGEVATTPLTVTPGRLHFADALRLLSVVVTNTSGVPVTLTPSLNGDGYRLPDGAPFVVPGHGSVRFVVERTDVATQALFGEVVFTSDLATQPELRVPLVGRFPLSCVRADVEQLQFPPVEAGCVTPMSRVRLTNECPHPVQLGVPEVAAPFSVMTSPQRLTAGASMELGVVFKASGPGTAVQPLTVPIDVLDREQRLVVGLRGEATPAPLHDDVFVVPDPTPTLDVLLVIDDTEVMAPYAASLLTNLGAFAQYLEANRHEPRVGVLSTSMQAGVKGRLRRTTSGAGWLDLPTPAEVQALGAFRGAQQGSSSCLEALDASLSAPLRNDPTELGGFLRPGAGLFIVCITANADAVREAPSTVLARIDNAAPKPMAFAVVARFLEQPVGGGSCTGTLDTGVFSAVTSRYNSTKEEVCTPNWDAALARLGRTSFGWNTSFLLRRTPDLERAPLRVFIDDQELPGVDPDPHLMSRIWAYDPVQNAVDFEPIYAPEPNRVVRARYAPLCGQ